MTEQAEPTIAFSLLDEQGQSVASRASDRVFYAASTIKLGVLIAAMQQVDAGELYLESTLESKHEFVSRIAGAGTFAFVPDEIDHGMPPVGQHMSIREALHRMIVVSSNEATNMLVEILGFDAVNEVFAATGAQATKMTRMIGDYAAREAGFTHVTTAADLAKIMRAIVTGEVASAESTAVMLGFLQDQEFPVIAEALGTDATWGSKSGWVDYIHHDVAFVRFEGGPTQYLAVCTEGLWVDQATEAIRAIASQLR